MKLGAILFIVGVALLFVGRALPPLGFPETSQPVLYIAGILTGIGVARFHF